MSNTIYNLFRKLHLTFEKNVLYCSNFKHYNMKKTQEARIRKHLESGKKINPLQALNIFGCFRLASRISDLIHKKGMSISKNMITRKGKCFAEYYLAE